MATSRRGFLRLLGSTAALGALARIPAAPPAARAAAGAGAGGAGVAFFQPDELEILTRVVERMVDTGEPGALRVADTGAVRTIDALCASLDPALTGPLPLLLRLVEWGPVLFDFTFTRFTRMSDAERDASLRAWMTSRLRLRRLGFRALRNLSMLGWYSQDESWPAVGYAGPLLGGRRAP